MLGQVQVDNPGASGTAFALKRHAYFSKAVKARDKVPFFGILKQVVLKLVEIIVVCDLCHRAGE